MKSSNENIVRFDVELTAEQSERLNSICKSTHRSRKNFAEALFMVVLSSKDNIIDLSTLGIVNQNINAK